MRSIVLLMLALALAVPASASGSVAKVTTFNDGLSGLPTSQIAYTAAAGERNVVTVDAAGDSWEIRDTGATIDAGAGCTLVDEHVARCTNARPGYYVLRIKTDDRDDRVSIPDDAGRTIVSGGAGDDVLRGGADVAVSGGDGGDLIELTGVPASLSCGRGSDLLGMLGRSSALHRVNVQACEHLRIGALVIAVRPRRRASALTLSARCAADGACRGQLSLLLRRAGRSAPVGARSFRLDGGERTTLRVPLTASERRLLARTGTVADVDVRAHDLRGSTVQTAGWRVRPAL